MKPDIDFDLKSFVRIREQLKIKNKVSCMEKPYR